MSRPSGLIRPLCAAIVLGVAAAPLMLSLVEPAAPKPQRQAHVAMQTYQFHQVRAAVLLTERANTPGAVPSVAHIQGPAEPGYVWRLSADVPSAPSMRHLLEPDPVQVALLEPVQPGLMATLME